MTPRDQLTAALAGRYEVEREIGAGGMATVYLARDVKHSRRVALKVLKPELGAVLGVDRFLSEIRVTANLQHPNLLPLFDLGEANGLLFYVMPFVEGESLRARLDREKQLPVDEAVRIAVAIAGALDYAHQHGVIHRDMKPENILLQAGQPVIADFGIALAVSHAGGARVTQTGLSLGTPQYMSPEQETGDRVIDGRTDICSLAADRFATAGDFSAALTGARPFIPTGATNATGAGAAPAHRMGARVIVLIGSLAAAALGSAAAAAWFATRPVQRPPAARFPLGLPDSVTLYGGAGTKLAFSRDGTKLVFVGVKNGKRVLYVRRIEDPVARPVRGSEAGTGQSNVSPTFSPGGDWIVYETDGELKKIPTAGGTALTLADSGAGGSWGDRNTLLYTWGGELWLGTPEGRDGRVLARPDTAKRVYRFVWPEVLPGGERALVALDGNPARVLIPDSLRLGVISLTTGDVTELGVYGTNPHYSATGHIVFGRAPNLVVAAPFSLRKRAITGPASLLLQNVWQGPGGATGFTVSDNGALAYHEGVQPFAWNLVIVDRSGASRGVPGEQLFFDAPRVSPDGRRIAAEVSALSGALSTSLIDVTTGARERLTPDDSSRAPEWTRDGSRIVFLRTSGGQTEFVSRAPDRSRADTVLFRERLSGIAGLSTPVQGPPRGLAAMEVRDSASRRWGVYLLPMDSMGSRRPFASGSFNNYSPTISADGRVLAWTSDESGSAQVYAQPIPGPGARVQVSVNGGTEPVWSRTGATLLYRGPSRIMSAEVAGPPLRVGRRDSLFVDPFFRFSINSRSWDVFPNGNEFLFVAPPSTTGGGGVFVVLNWPRLQALRGGVGAPER